ncbi:MAG: protein kinase [Anaerolineaceae bacterium]|nr:protein kinase [Anaerolineaceae bacterium]
MEHLIGQTLDRYKIIELLGEGGMGAVFRAQDMTLLRDVAIKVMHAQFARQSDLRERFLLEARTAARLRHPSIVQVHDFGQEKSLLYIIMEYIPGDNLLELLNNLKKQNKWILLEETIQLIRQIALALDYAHRNGILHRDIKPSNVMIVPEATENLPYRPVLTDLGLAKLLEGVPITREGVSMGTPAYMSPEQALGQKTDARSDVYSLGILLYELCVGRLPFPARTITEAIRYHTKEPPPKPRSIKADIPENIEKMILRAIEKKPENRFPDAGAFAQVLSSFGREASAVSTGAAVSLMTQYQQSLIEMRGRSVLDDFGTTPDVSQTQIRILDKDKNTRLVPFRGSQMTIGRGKENDIAIEDTKISRRHARIEFDGKNYHVIDLESTNGTFLENTKLLPGYGELWTPEKPLRMGSAWLSLVTAVGLSALPQKDHAGTEVELSAGIHQSVGRRVTAVLETSQYSVEAGGNVILKGNLLNQGQLVDHFNLNLIGVPSEWVTTPPNGVQLMPGMKQEVQISVHPPRNPNSKAGGYAIKFQVISRVTPEDITEVSANLTINPYYHFEFNLRPQKQRGVTSGKFTMVLRSMCNADLTFDFEAQDLEGICSFDFEPARLVLPAGEEKTGTIKVSSRIPRMGHQYKNYPFTVTARAQESYDLVGQARAEWEQAPLILEMSLSPPQQQGVGQGEFYVVLKNKGDVDIPIQLDALDLPGKCEFSFDPRSVVVPARKQETAKLIVRPKTLLGGSQMENHTFTVRAQLVEAPDVEQEAQGLWMQIPPSFEAALTAQKPKGTDNGIYSLQVKNTCNYGLSIRFNAADLNHKLKYSFNPPQIKVAANTEQKVQLVVQPVKEIYGEESETHPFSVSVSPVEAPNLKKEMEEQWEQLPVERKSSLFWTWLLIVIGWTLAWFVSGILVEGGLYYGLVSSADEMLGGVIHGLIVGGIGGLFTGWGLKAGVRTITSGGVIACAIGWAVVWGLVEGPLIYFLALLFS